MPDGHYTMPEMLALPPFEGDPKFGNHLCQAVRKFKFNMRGTKLGETNNDTSEMGYEQFRLPMRTLNIVGDWGLDLVPETEWPNVLRRKKCRKYKAM
jgi:hypothetical protein